MKFRPAQLGKLQRSERLAVVLLRGGELAAAGPELYAAFARVRDHALAAGFRILLLGSALVSVDEQALIGWLSTAQRLRIEAEAVRCADAQLEQAVFHCASQLAPAGLRLGLASQLRAAALVQRLAEVRVPSDNGLPKPAGAGGLIPAPFETRSRLQAIVLRELATHGPLHLSHFYKLGISRWVVWGAQRLGRVRRIGRGLYALDAQSHSQ